MLPEERLNDLAAREIDALEASGIRPTAAEVVKLNGFLPERQPLQGLDGFGVVDGGRRNLQRLHLLAQHVRLGR